MKEAKRLKKITKAKMRESMITNWEDIILFTLGKFQTICNLIAWFREVIIDRYVIIEKVGWGHFSTVWLAKDFKYNTFVALKIQKSAPHYLEAAYDEVEILQTVARNSTKKEWIESLKDYYRDEKRENFTRDDCHIVQLINSFIY